MEITVSRPHSLILSLCMLCTLICGSSAFAQIDASVPMDRYFPYYTAQFTSIPDVARFASQFEKTDIGVLSADPRMKPFHDSVTAQISSGPLKERLGITLNDLRNVANGEVAFGTIYPNKELLAVALMANISNHAAEANQLINKVRNAVAQNRGRVSSQQIKTAQFYQMFWVDKNNRNRTVVYIIDGGLLIVCDNLTIANMLWQKASNNPAQASVKPIAVSAYYQLILQKSRVDGTCESFSFAQIDRYAEALHLLNERYAIGKLSSKSPADNLKSSGLIGLRAVGGSLQFKPASGYDSYVKGFIYAPKPWTGSMNALQGVNVPCPVPPAWVSANVAAFIAVQVTPELIFDNIGPLFDSFYGGGEQGVWADVVEGLERDPMGPQINLKNDLVKYFDGQVLFLSQALEPLTENSECTAYALRVTNPAAVRSALERLFNGDPTVLPAKIGQYNIWQCVPKKKTSIGSGTRSSLSKTAKKEKPEGPMAHAAFTVENGYLIIASKPEYLAQLLSAQAQPLKDSISFKQTMAEVQKRCGNSACIWAYSPTENSYRLNYELFKQGKKAENKTILARLVKMVSNSRSAQAQQIDVDGSSLPPFDQIKNYFGPSGGYTKIEADGFSFEEFVLPAQR